MIKANDPKNILEVNYRRPPLTSARIALAFDITVNVINQDDCKKLIRDVSRFVMDHEIVASANITLSGFSKEDADKS